MKSAVAEITRISDSLPPQKMAQLLEYARSLVKPPKSKTKTKASKPLDGDAEWDRIINDRKPRPKLEAVRKRLDKLDRDGKLEPFDFNKL